MEEVSHTANLSSSFASASDVLLEIASHCIALHLAISRSGAAGDCRVAAARRFFPPFLLGGLALRREVVAQSRRSLLSLVEWGDQEKRRYRI